MKRAYLSKVARIPTASYMVLLGLFSLVSVRAEATYSIAAVDTDTRSVGGVSASCIGPGNLSRTYASAPGVGVVLAQASTNRDGRDEALRRLLLGESPTEILLALAEPSFDPAASRRQYGVVDLAGQAAGFTGSRTLMFAGDLQGMTGPFVYSVQGNILTGEEVLTQSRDGFEAPACDLAARLMNALEGGAAAGAGDRRCTPGGIPADNAFIRVDRDGEEAGTYLFLEVSNTDPADPVELLRAEFDVWRQTHPCPAAGVDAGVDAAVPDGSIADAGEPSDAGVVADAGAVDDGDGCSIGMTRSAPFPPSAFFVLAAVVLRRSRRSNR